MNPYTDPTAPREYYEEKVRKAEREHRAHEIAANQHENRRQNWHLTWAILSTLRLLPR
jgi:hypothetical protein